MFIKRQHTESQFDNLITKVASEMMDRPADSQEFEDQLAYLEKLANMRKDHPSSRVSPDTMAVVLGNLLGVVMILQHERIHVVTSKAVAFLPKLR